MLSIIGGIGLFLLGMVLLTDGLKAAAGDALRRVLTHFTGGRMKSLLSGVAVTALVQSSSATTLTTIGFVSAGLLTFPQAVGVIFGANLGTTSTGWIVSLLGLKLNIGVVALPLVAGGALTRLLGRGRPGAVGLALAGFGLIFVGIDMLQLGMADLALRMDPGGLPGSTAAGRLLLVGVGLVMTVVMQSSSAALATTLTAVASGTIDLQQGAALVIGQNVGTTVTAGLAAIGASVPAKRTALAHVLFNVLTGIVAFAVLPVMLQVAYAAVGPGAGSSPTTLAAFHTVFKVLGVALLLPVLTRFCRLIERMLPDRGPVLTRHLDTSVTSLPPVAVEAARRTLFDVLHVAAAAAAERLAGDGGPSRQARADACARALEEVRAFMARVRSAPDAPDAYGRHVATLHVVDHLQRFLDASEEGAGRPVNGDARLVEAARILSHAFETVAAWTDLEAGAPASDLAALSGALTAPRDEHRRVLLELTARGDVSPAEASRLLERMRWIDRLAYHLWRAAHHLGDPSAPGPPTSEVPEDPSERDLTRL
jgi:phosphate:Na+ symporter